VISTQASLTGHLVLSTLHTNDSSGAVSRLLDMGVEPFLVSSSLLGVVGQRLVRVLCPRCREPVEVPASALQKLDERLDVLEDHVRVYKPRGCPACNGHGYRGRVGVFELLVITDAVRKLILAEAPSHEIARVAAENGTTTMIQSAVGKVLQGVTSVEEALRVVDAVDGQ
jgi:type II secretory ATPase GspE/PulE/Tfp pilus assembly ATPase PilB-like protein